MSLNRSREIALSDPGVEDLPTELAAISPDMEPILLSVDEAAPWQMARTVKGGEGLEANRVIANVRPNQASVASSVVDLATIGAPTDNSSGDGCFILGGGCGARSDHSGRHVFEV